MNRITPSASFSKQTLADVVVFDLERVRDRATILEPAVYPAGVDFVIVNGELTVDEGRRTGALPGRVLRRDAVSSP